MGEDLLLQLLLILPPKTLMRFKCVSKLWYALISSPEFVAKHVYNSEHNNLSSCVLFRRPALKDTGTSRDTGLQFSLLNFSNDNYNNDNDRNGDGEHSFLSSVEDIDAPVSMTNDLKPKGESLHIIGHCGGIICVEANSGELFLWNPAIEESRLLPPEPFLPKWDAPGSYYPYHEFLEAIGFGYDPKSNDYKVINIGFHGTEVYGDPDGFDMIVYPPRAIVYTLGSDTWREIETDSLETETTNLWPKSFQIYFDGMCYWLGHEQNKVVNGWDLSWKEYMRHVVILFDTCDEVFHDIPLPESLDHLFCFNMRLIVWDKSIALFGLHNNGIVNSASFGIWVMDEFGGQNNTWTKHFTFDLTEIARPLAFLNSDEILMVSEDEDERMLSYNLSTTTFKYLPNQRVPSSFGAAFFSRSYFFSCPEMKSMVVIYVRSLVSVTRRKTL